MADSNIKRSFYRNLLDSNTNNFKKNEGKHIALLGPRKCGKTSIIKNHIKSIKDAVSVYVDFSKISMNPETFAVEYIGNIAFSFLKKSSKDYKKFLVLDALVKMEGELNSPSAFSLIKTIENELLKIKPSQKLIVESAFRFADALGRDSKKKFVIVLDNVENLLDMNNFSQIKDVFSLMNFSSGNVSYIAASSAVKESLHTLKNFECYEMKNLDKDESVLLIEENAGKIDAGSSEEIFNLCRGNLYAMIAVSQRFKEVKSAKKAFLIELLQKNNSLYNYCNDSLNYYYNRARGQTLLKTILKVVANEELRLTDIAKKIYRSAPVTKSVIERLIQTDIIHKNGNKFCFTDDVLRLWVKLTSLGYEFDEIDDKMIDEVLKQL